MTPRFHACGASALLMDVAEGAFDLRTQEHLWSLTGRDGALRRLPGVRSVVLGVNNVLVGFDPFVVEPEQLQHSVRQVWDASQPQQGSGRVVAVPVEYDRSAGSELEGIARQLRLGVEEVIALHSGATYHVACIGAVPGFAYLVGMPPRLAIPRHQTPRPRIAKGSVGVGGAQTGVIPMDMPSGWHVLGKTVLDVFDPMRPEPCLLAPGDGVRFVDRGAHA